MSTGQVLDPPPPTIHVREKDVFSFCRHDVCLEAVYGVITYDVHDSEGGVKADCQLAIMFSVPHNRAAYSNEFGFRLLSPGSPCDAVLLSDMYSSNDKKIADGSELSISDRGYVIKGTMSQTSHATMKVDIYRAKK